ncbi:MAG TPA: hypothetical protein VG096_26195 [Bryobacteraceae bacterium]|jgi:hypothetical protein|nr:hypothetical protein [Bryobacteraceae bacterium]
MKNYLATTGLVALLVFISQSSLARAGTPLPGAIFTTVVDGSIVNANTQYTSKCAVYLDGGPGANAPAGAAGLPEGDYFFQVTDPSGRTLLSTDVVNNRRFHISTNGVIVAYTGTGGPPHPVGVDQKHPELGTITISVANTSCPTDFLDTSNGGGVYKVWVTPVASFIGDPTLVDNTCGNGCYHGFASSTSKTDNFKVKPNLATFCLSLAKQLLLDPNGAPSPGLFWPIDVTDPNGVTNNFFTNATDGTLSVCGLVAGSYTVTESLEGSTVLGLIVNGVSLPAQPVYSFSWVAGQPGTSVIFQNLLSPPQ